jgi:hypothetical protein
MPANFKIREKIEEILRQKLWTQDTLPDIENLLAKMKR